MKRAFVSAARVHRIKQQESERIGCRERAFVSAARIHQKKQRWKRKNATQLQWLDKLASAKSFIETQRRTPKSNAGDAEKKALDK